MSSEQVLVEAIASTAKNSIVGGPFGSNLVSKDYVPNGVPVIRGQNMGNKWVGGEFVFVTEEKALSLAPNKARPGDLIFTQRGTLGQVAIVPDTPYLEYIISQSQMKLSVDPQKADVEYLYYLFLGPEQQEYIRNNAIQTGVPHTNLGILKKTPITLPTLVEQQKIAGVLGSLDERIVLLRETNSTLEAIAQTLFKSWFVDFEPVHARARGEQLAGLAPEVTALFPDSFEESALGMIPKGWQAEPLDEIADFLNGLALQKYPPEGDETLPVIKIAQLRKGDTVGADRASRNIKPEYIIQNGDVLFSWSGSLEVEVWCGGEGALNQHLFKVTSQRFQKWFYLRWTKAHLINFKHIAASKATTMGHIQRKHLTEAMVVVPSSQVLAEADKIFGPLLDQWINNAEQAQTLANLRDTLLPRLISGQLRLPDAEQQLKDLAV
ncbi:restriction endonuclease subunit S [Aeromonas hydrophila]|uniref:restriction endonuclease subunit S n=1 Tax=Aeromonas hydrophila TaxID=644 RepID=UPI00059BA1BA|nr:restriction endonuclease subunit S [Aeromonas hydrophila]MCK0186951.1 restriction endonuclease subunit S [Aeromonas hydrophila]UCM56395.1 restriction endonuclease subunit S [Aeromonas hydrophila]UOV90851.1 restriction endonuclease subunit S [Aeromonas hydrophila]HAT1544794.1 restriction endonuclease subunit S [Aeromonas hydrophila]HAT1554940.1 restriction endonuclease subunit S [Aeromonas hydrophila]